MPAGSPSIEISGVHHTYKRSKADPVLKGLDLTLGTGFFGLLGANGAGKSTLMRIVCTLLKPSKGSVKVCGFDVQKDCLEVRRRLGYLPQEFSAWRLHRVDEVLDTLARISGLSDKHERRQRVGEVLEEVGLADVAHRKVKKLSGGMVRRLGVAQALVHQPQVLVVDEPTVGLDPEERMRFRQLMTEMGQSRTILLSTHIVADLGSGCNEIALLDGANIAFYGTPEELLRNAKGYVYEVNVGINERDEVEAVHEIVSREPNNGLVKFRLVRQKDISLPKNATEVNDPTLEEGYLAFMASRDRLEAARQEEEAT